VTVLEPVSVGLKLAFLAVLYLFLLWVSRSALKDLQRGWGGPTPGRPAAAPEATSMHSVAGGNGSGTLLLVVESAPGHSAGSRYDVTGGATLGRGDVEVVLEDPFASTRHARIERQGTAVVLEDLGSTNGTYLNEELLTGPRPLHEGDRIRIGDSTFTFQA
jgi:pSer/pThr/pTyr-binding forkhead associated (FHA) protein